MLIHILSLLGLMLLCGGWVLFQGWLSRQDPEYKGYKVGCGACKQGNCSTQDGCDTAIPAASLKRSV
ncbi:MAG: hypothetical protein JMN24_17350 [gamma proteobacterium endosymbiont of Lamellibrachia anaximandri]|nr:hypothetical protein [gamma proteobacterium endosymbiont of Lamellibrachia anaximandri]MBL3619120.1 hypothetical protein [gamma proteobacterium endosymbiont of Lamellibrachia anaximandri]